MCIVNLVLMFLWSLKLCLIDIVVLDSMRRMEWCLSLSASETVMTCCLMKINQDRLIWLNGLSVGVLGCAEGRIFAQVL